MKSFYIVTNEEKDKNLIITNQVKSYLEKQGCKVNATPKDAECILVLGGDGTLLQAARDFASENIPLLGINLGTLGYLAEVDTDSIPTALEHLVKDEYETEHRMMINGTVMCKDSETEEFALNDIVLVRSGPLRVIHYHIYVNGQFLKGYSADGIIVSTPTGSTGYNMSAGGPIVEPKAELMVLTPICPHTLNTRSIVLAPKDVIEIEICPGKDNKIQDVEVNFDGSHSKRLTTGDRIKITRSEKQTKILKLSKLSFLEVLHRKMN
ncbi:MAG: NAD(+)/NADH kinase [Lachnospiraceae bacterium]|nr:NAD(+)/NADH kinase [Lachnospiraceae bacterium]